MADKNNATVLKDGQLAIATVGVNGTLVSGASDIDTTALVQTDDGEQLCVKTFPLDGGGGGTSDYTDLSNKPQINSVELSGDKSAADLGLQPTTRVVTMVSSSTQLATNTIYNGGAYNTFTLTIPATVPASFICQVNFTSGNSPSAITATGIYFNGDACDGGVLTPTAGHRYSCLIMSDGLNVLGFVYEK